MKKVLFTSHTANFQKFNHPFMQWFKQQGYIVHYASMGEEPVTHCDKHFKISFSRSPFSTDNIKAYKPLKNIIEQEQYDIIHCHTPMGGVVTRLAARKARKNGTKVIYTAHGFHFFKGAPLQNWLVYYPIEKLLSRYTDTIITINSEDYALAKRKMKACQIVKINGVGVDLHKFQPVKNQAEKHALRKKYGFNNNDFILICVAELNGNKNQEFLIKCTKQLVTSMPNIKLLLCGTGGFEQKYTDLINSLGLQDYVLLMGYRTDIEQLIKLADVGVAASYREGLPISVLEEIACGLPVLASANRGHKDIVTSSTLGYLYTTNNAAEYLSALQSLANNTTKLAAERHNATQQYSVTVALSNLEPVYVPANKELDPTVEQELPVPAFNLGAQAAFYNKLQGTNGSLKRIRRIVDEQTASKKANIEDIQKTIDK